MTDLATVTLFDAMQDAAIDVAHTLSVAGDLDLPPEVRQSVDRYRSARRAWSDAVMDDAIENGLVGR